MVTGLGLRGRVVFREKSPEYFAIRGHDRDHEKELTHRQSKARQTHGRGLLREVTPVSKQV
jgi:hypothetical protein